MTDAGDPTQSSGESSTSRSGLAGTRVGPYEVRDLLGTGGFATVYRAHDPRLQSDVAIKVLADNHALNADIRERFVSEGHLLRRIDNPAGLQVYDIGETEQGNPFLVLQLADRGDFEARVTALRATDWMPGPDDVRALITTLTEALDAFHDHDVVHRDVKPSNLLIASTRRKVDRGECAVIAADERLLLADLGLAKDLAAASGFTVAGGSAGYAAAEQMKPGSLVDTRADVYAASAAVAWLLSGRTPRDGSAWESFCDARFAALIPPLQAGLSDDREHRPQSIEAWSASLLPALDAPGIATQIAAPETPAQPAVGQPTSEQPISEQPISDQRVAELPPPSPPMPAQSHQLEAPSGTPRRLGAWLAAAATGLLVVVVALVLLTRGPNVTVLDDGRSQVEATTGDSTIAIIGPATAEVGAVVRYEVRLAGIDQWTLIGPDGVRHDNSGGVDVSASSAGSASVRLEATTDSGESIDTELPIRFVDP